MLHCIVSAWACGMLCVSLFVECACHSAISIVFSTASFSTKQTNTYSSTDGATSQQSGSSEQLQSDGLYSTGPSLPAAAATATQPGASFPATTQQ